MQFSHLFLKDEVMAEEGEESSLLAKCRNLLKSVTKVDSKMGRLIDCRRKKLIEFSIKGWVGVSGGSQILF